MKTRTTKRILSVNQMAWAIAIDDGDVRRLVGFEDIGGATSRGFDTILMPTRALAQEYITLATISAALTPRVVRVQVDVTPVEKA